MKKKFLIFLLATACVATVAGFVGCNENKNTSTGDNSSTPEASSSVETPNENETANFSWSVTMPNSVQYQNPVNVPTISVYEECTIQTAVSGTTYISSDTSVLSVSNLGVVRGLKAGTATVTVTAGEESVTLNFVVNEAGNVPIIVFENSNVPKNDEGKYAVSLLSGGAINVGARLKYNGLAYTSNISFTYETDNGTVATIENGMLKALGEGTTTVRVKVNEWRGYTSENLVQTIVVTVNPNVSVSVAEEEIALHTKTIENEITSFELNPSAIVNEAVDENAQFTFEYDNAVVSVSDTGEITAVGEGETQIKISYQTAGGYKVEKFVNVTVNIPITQSTVNFIVDKGGLALEKTVFSLPENEEYTRIVDVATGVAGMFTDGVFTSKTMATGTRELVVYTNKQGYKIQALVVDKIIKTEADLFALKTDADVSAYYVLGGNIQLTKTFDGITSATFKGTFDGMGYSISGGKIVYGLLGNNTLDATVKNLAMVNVGIAPDPINTLICTGGMLARTMGGNTTIENVYLNMNNPDAYSRTVGVVAYCFKGTANITNLVSYIATDRTITNAFVEWFVDSPIVNVQNVHCGAAIALPLVTTNPPASIAIEKYNSKNAIMTAYANQQIDVSWATDFAFYSTMIAFLSGQ